MKWKDETSYSQSDKHPRTPRAYGYDLNALKIKVHRYHGLDGWFLSCYEFKIELRGLKSDDHIKAKSEALGIMKSKIEERVAQYQKSLKTISDELSPPSAANGEGSK